MKGIVRLGTNPIAWSNDDLIELGGETPLETCLEEAREAGFSGIELGNKFPRRADVLKPILNAHGLELISGWYSSNLLERPAAEEIAALQDHLSLLKAAGCEVMVFAETTGAVHGDRSASLKSRPTLSNFDWEQLTRRLTKVGNYLADQGVRLAYHHHMGTVIETEAEIDRLMAETGSNVGLLFDTGHAFFAGGTLKRIAENHAGRIVHVHCKDIREEKLDDVQTNDMSFLDGVIEGVFTVPGDGMIDFKAALTPLAKASYSGWLVVEAEQDPARANPLQYAKLGWANLNRLAKEVGFKTL